MTRQKEDKKGDDAIYFGSGVVRQRQVCWGKGKRQKQVWLGKKKEVKGGRVKQWTSILISASPQFYPRTGVNCWPKAYKLDKFACPEKGCYPQTMYDCVSRKQCLWQANRIHPWIIPQGTTALSELLNFSPQCRGDDDLQDKCFFLKKGALAFLLVACAQSVKEGAWDKGKTETRAK